MDNNYIIINCPHCKDNIIIFKTEFNCKIFRHGVYKNTLQQIEPHMPKIDCENLINNNLIYGCGKPFKIIETNLNNYTAMICEYI